jgi:hypothetical protein
MTAVVMVVRVEGVKIVVVVVSMAGVEVRMEVIKTVVKAARLIPTLLVVLVPVFPLLQLIQCQLLMHNDEKIQYLLHHHARHHVHLSMSRSILLPLLMF